MIFTNEKIGGMCVLMSQLLERITFYSIQANFVYILNSKPLEWSMTSSMNTTFILSGFCFVATMFGGILSDTIFKKSTTVIIGYVCYSAFVGYILVFYKPFSLANKKPLEIHDYEILTSICSNIDTEPEYLFQEKCANVIIPVTLLSAIGSGLIKSVIASIGADIAVKQWKNPSVFFNLYYWSLNMGSLIAFGVIAYIQQNVLRFIGYLIPGITLVLSFIFFLIGLPYYINVNKPTKNTLNLVFSVYFEAISKKISTKTKKPLICYQISEHETETTCIEGSVNRTRNSSITKRRADYPSLNTSFRSDSELSSDDTSSIADTTTSECLQNISFFERCKIRFGGSFTEDDVENVKRFSQVIIVLLYLVPYWILYFQMETTFVFQGLHMKILNLEWFNQPDKSIPVCWLTMTDIITIMILLPILIKVVYPYLRRKHIFPNNYFRIICGMFLAIVSVTIAGIIEKYNIVNPHSFQAIGETNYSYSNISVLAQIPQYVIMGLSESQAIVVGLELACTQVPVSMQGMTNGLFWFFSGVGSFLGTSLVTAFNISESYIGENEVFVRSQYYFFWLAIIETITLLLFIPYVYRMRSKEKDKRFLVTSSITDNI